MREYHVDCHPAFFSKYVSSENKKYGGNLSVRLPVDCRPKKDIMDAAPFCRFFEYGAHRDGYWNFHHAALQLEDVVDCLAVLFRNFDFVFLFEQSSGHGKLQKDGL